MRKYTVALMLGFMVLFGASGVNAQDQRIRTITDPSWSQDRGNGWTGAMGFHSVPKPDAEVDEGEHDHTFLYVFKWKTKAACDEAMHGEHGDRVAQFSALIVGIEQREGYDVKNVKFACVSVPPEDKRIRWAEGQEEKDL